jgi:hypothetical protein
LEEPIERGPFDNHGRVQPSHQVLHFLQRHERSRLTENDGLNLGQAGSTIEVANDLIEQIDGEDKRLREDSKGVLEHNERLTLVLDSPRHDRTKSRSFEKRHNHVPGFQSTHPTLGKPDPVRTESVSC